MSARRPADATALEIIALAKSETFGLHERTIQGLSLNAYVHVFVCSSLDPLRASEIPDEVARRLRLREPVAEPPTLRAVRQMLCRIGGAS